MIRVLLVDDHQVVRAGLGLLLGQFADIDCVGQAADGAEAVTLAGQVRPEVILMDLSMPGMDGVAATREVLTILPGARIVALTTFADRSHVTAALDAGAVGYLLKDSDAATLHAAIVAAAGGQAPLDPRAARVLVEERRSPRPAAGPKLTEREQQVLALLADGLSNRLIARRLGISEKTVKTHLTNIFATLMVADRVQAALWWQANATGYQDTRAREVQPG